MTFFVTFLSNSETYEHSLNRLIFSGCSEAKNSRIAFKYELKFLKTDDNIGDNVIEFRSNLISRQCVVTRVLSGLESGQSRTTGPKPDHRLIDGLISKTLNTCQSHT